MTRKYSVELFSPDGKCQFELSPNPAMSLMPTLAFIDEKIIACPFVIGNTADCWQYNVTDDSWIAITSLPLSYTDTPGVAHNDKIYIIPLEDHKVYDPKNNSWTKLPAPLEDIRHYPCMISLKDSILVFFKYSVHSFNTTSNSWSVLNEGTSPFRLLYSKCILLPKNQVLVLSGSDLSIAIFDIQTNSWEKLEDSNCSRYFRPSIVNLNGRFFMFGCQDDHRGVVEFHYETKTWTEVEAKTKNQNEFSSALALPAEMFSHLPGGCEGIK